MVKNEFIKSLKKTMGESVPTEDQLRFFYVFTEFIFSNKERCALILNGYAGTGKTTMISCLVPNLKHLRMKSVLLAPTGRAAKVMSSYSGKNASTIHRKIYRQATSKQGHSVFIRQNNLHTNTLFIVDEASMIGDGQNDKGMYERQSLLDDLIDYVYSGNQCRLLFVGDTAQLPPVSLSNSPALHLSYLRDNYFLNIAAVSLTTVMEARIRFRYTDECNIIKK